MKRPSCSTVPPPCHRGPNLQCSLPPAAFRVASVLTSHKRLEENCENFKLGLIAGLHSYFFRPWLRLRNIDFFWDLLSNLGVLTKEKLGFESFKVLLTNYTRLAKNTTWSLFFSSNQWQSSPKGDSCEITALQWHSNSSSVDSTEMKIHCELFIMATWPWTIVQDAIWWSIQNVPLGHPRDFVIAW